MKDSDTLNRLEIRKTLMVEPDLQKEVIANFVFLSVFIISINILMSYLMIKRIIGHVETANQPSPELYDFIINTSTSLMIYTLLINIATVIGFGIYGLIFSNRIAGPVFNLNRTIKSVLDGKSDAQVSFRKDDYFHELSENMNLLFRKIK